MRLRSLQLRLAVRLQMPLQTNFEKPCWQL
jgi:hypothetical protein